MITLNISVNEAANRLVRYNHEADAAIERTYIFPSDQEVRLIHIDTTSIPLRDGEEVAPFHFRATPQDGIPYPSAVALVRPEEEGVVAPPAGWGEWNTARVIQRG